MTEVISNSDPTSSDQLRTYAIALDLDTKKYEDQTKKKASGAYPEIEKILEKHTFKKVQGTLYFGNEITKPWSAYVAVQELTRAYSWFKESVTDIRMMRVDESNDLNEALTLPDPGQL